MQGSQVLGQTNNGQPSYLRILQTYWSVCSKRFVSHTVFRHELTGGVRDPHPMRFYRFSMEPMFLSAIEISPLGSFTNSMYSEFRAISAGNVTSIPVSVRIF